MIGKRASRFSNPWKFLPGFRPRREYLREMKRDGVLPATFDVEKDMADPYDLDRRYWEFMWHRPTKDVKP